MMQQQTIEISQLTKQREQKDKRLAELEAQEREAAAAIGRRVRPSANKLLDLREWLHAEDESS